MEKSQAIVVQATFPFAYHLTKSMGTLSVRVKWLLEKNLVLLRPLVEEWCEIRQDRESFFQVILVPKQHSQSLFRIIAVAFLRNLMYSSSALSEMSVAGDQTSKALSEQCSDSCF
jgi:hypothetical protein